MKTTKVTKTLEVSSLEIEKAEFLEVSAKCGSKIIKEAVDELELEASDLFSHPILQFIFELISRYTREVVDTLFDEPEDDKEREEE